MTWMLLLLGGIGGVGKRVVCGLRGHAETLVYAPSKLSLVCAVCGRETPGLQLALPPPALRKNVVRFRQRLKA